LQLSQRNKKIVLGPTFIAILLLAFEEHAEASQMISLTSDEDLMLLLSGVISYELCGDSLDSSF
jgi:hypothetical protein